MALQESIKRTETNQQIAAAIFYTLISQLSDHSLTKIKYAMKLYRNDGPFLPSYPSPLQPLPRSKLNLWSQSTTGNSFQTYDFLIYIPAKTFVMGYIQTSAQNLMYSFEVLLSPCPYI